MSGDFNSFQERRRRLAGSGDDTHCDLFMSILFDDTPSSVDVECISVQLTAGKATIRWQMSSQNPAAMDALNSGESFTITSPVDGSIVEVQVVSTKLWSEKDDDDDVIAVVVVSSVVGVAVIGTTTYLVVRWYQLRKAVDFEG